MSRLAVSGAFLLNMAVTILNDHVKVSKIGVFPVFLTFAAHRVSIGNASTLVRDSLYPASGRLRLRFEALRNATDCTPTSPEAESKPPRTRVEQGSNNSRSVLEAAPNSPRRTLEAQSKNTAARADAADYLPFVRWAAAAAVLPVSGLSRIVSVSMKYWVRRLVLISAKPLSVIFRRMLLA